MLDAGPHQLAAWIAAHWHVAIMLAGALFSATGAALALLPEAGRKSVSRWMRGAQSEETWATNFTTLFDAIFSKRHMSLRCFMTSTLVSLVTVTALWLGLGTLDGLGSRLQGLGAFGQVLALGLAVNALADYLSLLETRWLLGWLARPRPVWLQALVLIVDLVITAAIIWGALWAVQVSGLAGVIMGKGRAGLAEVVGLFSPLAVFFYSSFVTSIWTWGFILSSWLMRGLARLRWLHGVYAEHPGKALSAALGASTLAAGFAGSAAFGALTVPDAQDLSPFDRALCRFAKGEVCLHVRRLTENEATRLALTLDACRGGITDECLQRGLKGYETDGAVAARYWRAACDAGDAESCTNLGILHRKGIGMDPDQAAAARLYRQGCDGGDARGCTNLGFLHRKGIGMDPDPAAAARLYRQGCDGGNALGCTNLGILHRKGIGMDPDPAAAARLYRQGCDGGHARGCTSLGYLHRKGIDMDPDPSEAARLYRQGCDGGDAGGCTSLGYLHRKGIGMDPDPSEAARLYRQGCDGGDARGCTNLGFLHRKGIGMDPDPAAAARLYRQGCDGGNALGCTNLGILHRKGIGMDPDPAAAARLYRQGCDGGNALGCTNLGVLHEQGIGMEPDPAAATELYAQACEMDGARGCYYHGWNLEDGIGTDPDPAAAQAAYRKACDLGEEDACARIDDPPD